MKFNIFAIQFVFKKIKHQNIKGKDKEVHGGTSLVAQWLRISLPMQATWDWALVQEGPTCRRATKPVSHNYWACALEPACLEPMLRNKRNHSNEKPAHSNEE